MSTNPCILRNQEQKDKIFPARIFGYLALCRDLQQNTKKVRANLRVVSSNLPFVSNISNKFTPQALTHVHWSFLKY